MKINKLLYSTIALSVLGTAGFSYTNIYNQTIVNAKSNQHKSYKILGSIYYGESIKVYGRHGNVYKNIGQSKRVASLSKNKFKNKIFKSSFQVKIKLHNGKKVLLLHIKGHGISGYVNSKYVRHYNHKHGTDKQVNDDNQNNSVNNVNANSNASSSNSDNENYPDSYSTNTSVSSNSSYSTSNVSSSSSVTTSSSSVSSSSSSVTASSSSVNSSIGSVTSITSSNSSATSSVASHSSASSSNSTRSSASSTSSSSSANNSNSSNNSNTSSSSVSNSLYLNTGTPVVNISSSDDINSTINAALNQINQERANNGLSPLQLNDGLNQLAAKRAQQIVTNFSHYDDKGPVYEDMLVTQTDLPVITPLENLGYIYNPGQTLSQNVNESVHDMFYNDEASGWGHRHSFLSPDINAIGIGVFQTPDNKIFSAFDMGNYNVNNKVIHSIPSLND